MNKKTSIKAFSIIEAIVSMAVSAIIMGMVFVIFSIVSERMLDYKNQNQLINDLNRLTYIVNKDIFENQKMNLNDNEISFKSYSGNFLKYEFNDDFILRKKEDFIDTFRIRLNKISFDTVQNKTQNLVYQKIKLMIEVNENIVDLKFYKQVYANELLASKSN